MRKYKKSETRLISVIVLLAVIMPLIFCNPISVCAETTDVVKEGIHYKIHENGGYCEVVGYDETKDIVDVVIPPTIKNRKVKAVSDDAFAKCTSLKSVTLPKGLYSIGARAFYSCTSLESISIPSSVNFIGASAFFNCGALVNIVLPSSLTKVSDRTFYRCYSMKSVTIPNNCTSIGDSAFSECISLSRVKFDNNSKLSEISRLAFSGCCVLTAINVPASVEIIDDYAFDSCEKLTTVVLREGLKRIGIFAFANCDLKMIEIPQSVEEMGYYCVGFNTPVLEPEVVWVKDFKLYGQYDSIADKYAEVFGFEFSYGSPLLLGAEYSNGCVEFSFKGNYDTDGVYRVYRKPAGKTYELIGEAEASNSVIKFIDTSVIAGEEYVYNAEFVDSRGVVSRRNKDGISVICEFSVVKPPKTVKEKMKMYRELIGKKQ